MVTTIAVISRMSVTVQYPQSFLEKFNALPRNLVAAMAIASPWLKSVIRSTIATTQVMNTQIVQRTKRVQQMNLNAPVVTAFYRDGFAMVRQIVQTSQMNSIVTFTLQRTAP